MHVRKIVAALGAGFVFVACGGSTDSTGTTSSNVVAADGGGHPCQPLTPGAASPCAPGNGGGQSDDGDAGKEHDDSQDEAGYRDGGARYDGGRQELEQETADGGQHQDGSDQEQEGRDGGEH